MSAELTQAWKAAIAELPGDREVRAVVVTGEGVLRRRRADLARGVQNVDSGSVAHPRMLSFYRAWLWHPKSGYAVHRGLNGAAVGAGLALALACDLRYATPEAGLSMPFTSLGIHPGMASTFLLPEVSGLAVARGNVVDRSGAGRARCRGRGPGQSGPSGREPVGRRAGDRLADGHPCADRHQADQAGPHRRRSRQLRRRAEVGGRCSAADDGDPGPARGDRGSAATTEPGVHRA